MKSIELEEFRVRQLVDLISYALDRGYFDNGLAELRAELLKQAGLTMASSGRMT